MPGRRWSGEEKANIVLEILTTSNRQSKYAGGTTFDQPWSTAGKQVSFKQYKSLSGTDASDREKQLEQENKRLKEMVADLALANELLKKGRTRL